MKTQLLMHKEGKCSMESEGCDALGHVVIGDSVCPVYEFSKAELHDKAVESDYFNLADAEMMSMAMNDEVFELSMFVGTGLAYDLESGVYIELKDYPSHYIVWD